MPVISLYHDYNHNNVYYDLGIMNYPNIVDYYPKVWWNIQQLTIDDYPIIKLMWVKGCYNPPHDWEW